MSKKNSVPPFFVGQKHGMVGYRYDNGYSIIEISPNGEGREFCVVFSDMGTKDKAKRIVKALRENLETDDA